MNVLLLVMACMSFGLMMRCYRDETVDAIGRQGMCAKLSVTMQEYEACIKQDSIRIKEQTQD